MEWKIIILVALGLTLISFIHVWARHPRTIMHPSACSHCPHRLRWHELMPVISYFLLKKRCHTCHNPIPAWMPVVESMGGLLFALSIHHTNPVLWCVMGLLLLGCMACDMDQLRVPGHFLIMILGLSLYYKFDSWLSPCLLLLMLVILYSIFKWVKKTDPMGMGDIKLLTVLGFWIDPYDLPYVIGSLGFAGCLFGLLWQYYKKTISFPFVPPIAVVFLIYFWFNCSH